MPDQSLPIFYYRDHFVEMLDAVEGAYAGVVDSSHRLFMQGFRNLSHASQCLFIRMANRRGYVFHRSSLVYAEIDHEGALAELLDRGFARPVEPGDCHGVLALFDKTALLDMARHDPGTAARASWTKARLLAHLRDLPTFEPYRACIDFEPYLVREHRETLDFLLYLYFGRLSRDLKSFALRDLGLVAVNKEASLNARFADAAEAQACFRYSRLLTGLNGAAEADYALAVTALSAPAPTDYAGLLRAKLASHVGAYFEKSAQADRAIEVYRLADASDCNERLVRLLYAAGQVEDARSLLERIIDDPGSDAEYEFAADFYGRKFQRRRIGACTALLRDSKPIAVDDVYRTMPESGACAWFRRDGWTAHWTENGFWHQLFGLLFWDDLFGARALLHSGFDRMPRCLADKTFHTLHASHIAASLQAVRDRTAAALLADTARSHHGEANGLVNWDYLEIAPLADCLQNAPAEAMAAVLEGMCRDFYSYRDGFPDLMLTKPGAIRFVEVKAEGDVIRRNQLTRLRQMQRAGLDASICRVEYRYDPDQPYVVVDVETTGSRPGIGRVIEIGAVKMQGHRIVGEWQSLIDPGRSIPGFITRLTGITNAMVAGSPGFADVADEFTAFMGDGVFAAHNVAFDYGFIRSEFTRIDRTFRYPKFCTCAGMRRYYPGQASYGLGPLSEAFRVALDNHHRALDDARAAAALLSLINRKREVQAPAVAQAS